MGVNKKRDKEAIFVILLSITFVIFLSSFTSATVVVTSPNNGTNNSASTFFNVTFTNGTDITDPANATFYYNGTLIGNTSSCDAVSGSCAATIDTSGLPNGAFSINATIWNVTSNVNVSTGVALSVVFDNLVPKAQAANFTFTSGKNFSSSIVLNISVIDSETGINETSGIQTVYFNISLKNGTQNATFTQFSATNAGGDYWNYTIDTNWFNDGTYNITAWTTDYAGNQNNTALVSTIIFDNLAPTITFSCLPASVTQGNAVTCTCAGSDATSTVKTTTFTASPLTSSSGPHSETCTVTDYSGNSFSRIATFAVEGTGSSGGGGGGGGTSTPLITGTITLVESQISNGYTARFGENGKVQVEFTSSSGTSSTHSVQVTSITTSGATVVIASDPVTINLLVGETKKMDVDHDDVFDLSVKLNSIISGKVSLTITQIEEAIAPQLQPEDSAKAEIVPIPGVEESSSNTVLIVIVVIVLIIIIVAIVYFIRRNRLASLGSKRKR